MKSSASSEYFREMRLKKGLTQEELASSLGYSSKQIVSNWERGLCMPPLNILRKLTKALDLDKSELMRVFQNELQHVLDSHLSNRKGARKA